MNNFQRTVKYIAIAFAIVLAVGIVSGITHAAFFLVSAVTGNIPGDSEGTVDFSKTFTDVRNLDIDNSTESLIIKTGDTFKVEVVNVSDSFKASVTGNGTLKISDKHNDFFRFHLGKYGFTNSRITVYLPADFIAQEAKINSGAGSVSIESLHTDKLDISAGAGSITGDDMTAGKATINGGFGSINLDNINFTDAVLNCGVGSVKMNGILSGKNRVKCGVGEVVLGLTGNTDDYDLNFKSGIGSIRLNGEKVSRDYNTDRNLNDSIKIEGGIGSVTIDFNE